MGIQYNNLLGLCMVNHRHYWNWKLKITVIMVCADMNSLSVNSTLISFSPSLVWGCCLIISYLHSLHGIAQGLI